MNRDSWQRWAPLAGVAFAVLYLAGLLLIVLDEVDEMEDGELLAYYADGAHRSSQFAGFLLVVVGVVMWLLFASTLRSRLRAAEPEGWNLSGFAFAAGIATASLLIGAATSLVGTSFAVDAVDRFAVDANLARFAIATGYVLLLAAALTQSGLVVATSVAALRTDALPSWLGWLGFVAVAVALAEAVLLPVFALPVWTIVVSVVLARREPSGVTARGGVAPARASS